MEEMRKSSSQLVHQETEDIMGLVGNHQLLEKDYVPNSSTPKLSLSKLPNKHKFRETMVNFMATPPRKISVSIPFQWEEAPGKPRSSSINSNTITTSTNTTTTARRLHLPPRLVVVNNNLNNCDFSSTYSSSKLSAENYYSPTTVLDGPDQEKEYSALSLEEEFIREVKYHHHYGDHQERSFKCSSWGLKSLKEEGKWPPFPADRSFMDFPSSASAVGFPHSKSHSTRSCSSYKLLPRFKRRSSFASLSNASSNFLAGVYGNLKQAVVQWRRRQDQKQS
ncbi:OLC1v1027870C1 [Oldenlandia corymbosa var. corymbosa]|uniref:OLC1v1027870C1 n=1 Tax=Oldenlandia corymbosa var. corymbosa TaxID=529605 RepID=A0AAV1CB65_OLDCO|nr:OLC1v1027870C1 [Oldenlandia corymbosa var. corymbosa]